MPGGNTNTKIQFSAQGLSEIKSSAISLLRDMVSLNESLNKESLRSLEILRAQISLLKEKRNLLSGLGTSGRDNTTSRAGVAASRETVAAIDLLRIQVVTENEVLIGHVREIKELLKVQFSQNDLPPVLPPDTNIPTTNNSPTQNSSTSNSLSRDRNRSGIPWTRDIFNLMNMTTEAFKSEDYAQLYTKGGKALGGSLTGAFGGFGAIAGIPLILASMGAETLIDYYDKRQRAARKNIQLFGGSMSENASLSRNGNFSGLGYSYIDTLEERERLSQALGRKVSNSQILDSFRLQRGAGVDESTIQSLLRLFRGSKGVNLSSVVGGVVGTQGLGKDFSLLDEHLQVLVGISEQQLQEYGKTNLVINNQILGGLSKLSEDFKNPQVLQGVFQKVLEGSQQAKTPQFQALQYRALDEVSQSSGMKNASVWDLTKIMKDPTNPLFAKYMTSLMNNLYKSLGEQNFEMVLESQYGFGVPQINSLSKAMRESKGKGISLYDYNKIVPKNFSEITERAQEATTSLEKRGAQTTNFKGAAFDAGLDQATEKVLGVMQAFNDGLVSLTKSLDKLVREANKASKR